MEVEISTPDEVFQALEKVFRPESNQNLARFKFQNMKQKASQTCDSYMSELRLALPECKYRNDVDELLKDQFIFGIYNKEIQDHLLGKINETDNSVKSLFETRKIKSKLAKRKMLGIANPGLVSVDEIKNGKFKGKSHYTDCKYCGRSHNKGECPAFGKTCHNCGCKNHFESKCRNRSRKTNGSESKRDSGKGQMEPEKKCSCCVHEIHEGEHHEDSIMEDLNELVQSLFYA